MPAYNAIPIAARSATAAPTGERSGGAPPCCEEIDLDDVRVPRNAWPLVLAQTRDGIVVFRARVMARRRRTDFMVTAWKGGQVHRQGETNKGTPCNVPSEIVTTPESFEITYTSYVSLRGLVEFTPAVASITIVLVNGIQGGRQRWKVLRKAFRLPRPETMPRCAMRGTTSTAVGTHGSEMRICVFLRAVK